MKRAAIVAVALLCGAHVVRAQEAQQLESRLDRTTRTQVLAMVAEAEKDSLPTRPLIAKALEGASKGATDERILLAVRAQLEACRRARAALGRSSSEAEIVAGASALGAGVPSDTLVVLRTARPRGSLVVPIVVISDMVARRVPIGVAANAVLAPTRAGAQDADLLALRQQVDDAIRSGLNPASAANLRSKAWISAQSRSPGHEPAPPGPANLSGKKGER